MCSIAKPLNTWRVQLCLKQHALDIMRPSYKISRICYNSILHSINCTKEGPLPSKTRQGIDPDILQVSGKGR